MAISKWAGARRSRFESICLVAIFALCASASAEPRAPELAAQASAVASPSPTSTPWETAPAFTLLPAAKQPDNLAPTPRKASDPFLALEKDEELATLQLSTAGPLSPYIGAGLENPETSESTLEALVHRKRSVSYQIGAGFGYRLGGQTRLGFDYRYTPSAESSLLEAATSNDDPESNGHRISFDLKIRF